MQPERQYAATVVSGVAALALCFALQASAPVIVGAGVVYAAAGYYTAEHPDAMWSGRSERSWESGALAGVSTFGTLGVLNGTHDGGVTALAFGLLWFGFVNGVAYARDRED